MFKAVGMAMVMTAAFSAGWLKRRELAVKVEKLKRLRWEAGRIRAEIGGRGLSLEACFRESEIFSSAAEKIGRGVSAEEAVMGCGAEAEGLGLFAKGLGAETVEGQLENLDIFIRSLERELAAAREDLEKKGRMWPGLGILGGAAVCVMFA